MRGRFLVLVAALLCGVGALSAQESGGDSAVVAAPSAVVEGESTGAADDGAANVGTTSGGLPQRAAPPRTMAGQWPIFVMFSVTWIGLIGYFLAGIGRSRKLAERLIALEEER